MSGKISFPHHALSYHHKKHWSDVAIDEVPCIDCSEDEMDPFVLISKAFWDLWKDILHSCAYKSEYLSSHHQHCVACTPFFVHVINATPEPFAAACNSPNDEGQHCQVLQ